MADNSRILDLAVETRKFEIGLFWQRSLFFWGFIAAAFVAYATLSKDNQDKDLPFVISCFELICSVAWTLGNRGGKYWQEAWEQKLHSVELIVLGRNLFHEIERREPKGWWGGYRYSVSRLAIALSDFTVAIWLVLAVKSFPARPSIPQYVPISLLIAIGTGVYLLVMLIWGRSGVGKKSN